jgi:hypothetical protein
MTQKLSGFLACLCLIILFAAPAVAADIDGTWVLERTTADGVLRWFITLKADGETLSGTVQRDGAENKRQVLEGKVNGNEFTFSTMLPRKSGDVKLSWSGSVEGGQIKGNIKTANSTDGLGFIAKKQ